MPSKRTDTPASDRSNGTERVTPSSSDDGPTLPGSVMRTTSGGKPWYGHGSRKDYSEAVALYEQGWSIGKVAERHGVSRQAMWKILRRRTTLRSRSEAMALTRKPETAVRRHRGRIRDRYRKRAARITVGQMRAVRARDVVCQECLDEGTDFDHMIARRAGRPDDAGEPATALPSVPRREVEAGPFDSGLGAEGGELSGSLVDLVIGGFP